MHIAGTLTLLQHHKPQQFMKVSVVSPLVTYLGHLARWCPVLVWQQLQSPSAAAGSMWDVLQALYAHCDPLVRGAVMGFTCR